MPHIPIVTKDSATPEQLKILTIVEQAMGGVPNLISTMAQSPAVTQAYLTFSKNLSERALSSKIRERISLAVGEGNSCHYCVSAHSMLGKQAGIDEEEIINARRGTSSAPRTAAALDFTRKVLDSRGQVSEEAVRTVMSHGFSYGEVVELVAHVALNIFTNYFNHVAGTAIDFPLAPELPES